MNDTEESVANDIASETGSNLLTIQGLLFPTPVRYTEGYTLNTAEARQLQQTYREALRNNFASAIKKAMKEASVEDATSLSDEVKATLADTFAKYTEDFQFASRTGVSKTPVDPVEKEAIKLVTPLVRKVLADKKVDVKSLADGVFEKLVQQALTKRPDIREEAERRVNAAKAIANIVID